MDIDECLLTCEESMDKTVDYLKGELRGVRTGRASTALVEFIKVDYYGAPTELRQLALINVPEPTQILIKPFDASCTKEIGKAIAYLASHDARFITGAALPIDGGGSAGR